MRKFKCYDCDHSWELPFGQGGRGMDQVCPECGSKNVHRTGGERGRGKRGRGWGSRWGGEPEIEVDENDT